MTAEAFRQQHPEVPFLDPGNRGELTAYLRRQGVLAPAEAIVTLAKAGEGNMNCVLRAGTDQRTFIVKQARPWVEKYPQFTAPWDRALREMEFYRLASGIPAVADAMPRLRFGDPVARILVLEDLGSDGDYTGLYRGERLSPGELDALVNFLSELHAAFAQIAPRPELPNREMRALNHAHIYEIPLARANGLDLDAMEPGLQAAANAVKADDAYCREVTRLGHEVYLTDGPCLLHGDFFPGSLIRTPGGPRVIDPEFCFFGPPEYDVAVLMAHLFLAGQPSTLRQRLWKSYRSGGRFRDELMLQLAGVEIMRRLIGYAQLPLGCGLAIRRNLLDLSRELVLHPRPDLLDVHSARSS